MTRTALSVAFAALAAASGAFAGEFQLPPEVTPQLRAACETDVRRLCIGQNPTEEKVKSCVAAKFALLGRRCQVQLALAGFKP
jgi:hypothetical protein